MFRSAATSAMALILGAAPVLADVTPAQVWENLERYYTDFGYEVTGDVEDAGGTLTVTDAVLSMTNEGSSSRVTIPQMTFQETGDAKVRATIEGDVTLDSRFMVPAAAEPEADAPAEGAPADGATADDAPAPAEPRMIETTMTGTISLPGNEMLVSGTAEDMLYEYTYPSVSFDIALPVDPERGASVPLSGSLTNVAGTQRSVRGEGATYSFDLTADDATLTVAADSPANPAMSQGSSKVDIQARLTGLTAKGSADAPAQTFDLATQLPQALAAGFGLQSDFAYESMETRFSFAGHDADGQEQTGQGSVLTAAGDLAVQLTRQGFGYRGNATDNRVEMTVSSLPIPITYAAERTGFDLLMPVSRAEEAQPFKLAYSLEGLTFADEIWNLFDPTSQLPRDPATLIVDLAGDAMVSVDLFDPARASPDAEPQDSPFTPRTLTVNRVALDAVGAKADITGALEFGDNPNEPVGSLNGTFEGVNGLMDKLIAMGLVPEDQMMGLRMMLAMFAKPAADNPDQLTSEIEFREGGSIFANGQQIR